MTPKHTPHIPVMLEKVVELFVPQKNQKYLDATLGAGGHTLALLQAGATVTSIDQDQSVLDLAVKRIADAGYSDHFTALQGSFANLLSSSPALDSDYNGILFDLGVSSLQLDTPKRGFSFRFDAPLDMRMDPDHQAVTAADLVNGLGRKELVKLFRELSQERHATLIADAICQARKLHPIKTTFDLVKIIESKIKRTEKIHPATRVFQALRMAVNTERDELKAVLPSALSKLASDGLLIVISFHSGEDSIVKTQFQAWVDQGLVVQLADSPFNPTQEEIKRNPRSRSAIMRVVRKTT